MSQHHAQGDMEITQASAVDLDEIVRLLHEADLPTEDVAAIVTDFWVARIGGELVGSIALERYGEIGLLRSLAVAPSRRGRGIAAVLCDHLVEQARGAAVSHLYLLTTDAARYFERHGFAAIDRDRTPAEIRGTTQFSELCPDTAVVMFRQISGAAKG